MELALNQVGWVGPTVDELYYGLNPISLDDSRTTLLERSFFNGSARFFSNFTSLESQLYPIDAEQT